MQMVGASSSTQILSRNISDLLCLSLAVHDNQIADEIKILRAMQSSVIDPIGNYYFVQESLLCDVPAAIHENMHDYGLPRNRKINELSDYDALLMTNFSKNQLRRIYRCFNFGQERINVHCSQGHNYTYEPGYIFYLDWLR